MTTPLSDTGNVRSLMHSSHIFIFFFMSVLKIRLQNYKKIAFIWIKNLIFVARE